jgi:transcriptional regulator with XRE-family HTH domain
MAARRSKCAEPDTLGALIRKLRKTKGLSQVELAEKLGYSGHEIISRWENDHQKPPVETLIQLAKATDATDADVRQLILLSYNTPTRFPPCETTLRQLKQIAHEVAQMPFPAYVIDYRGRYWIVNEAIARMTGVSLDLISHLLRMPIDYLMVVFNSQFPFKHMVQNYEIVAEQQVARFKQVNLYRRNEDFYRNYLERAAQVLPPDDHAYLAKLWCRLNERKIWEISGLYPEIILKPENASQVRRYWLHVEPFYWFGTDLFELVWYGPQDWTSGPQERTPQDVLCLWDVMDVERHFADEWLPSENNR